MYISALIVNEFGRKLTLGLEKPVTVKMTPEDQAIINKFISDNNEDYLQGGLLAKVISWAKDTRLRVEDYSIGEIVSKYIEANPVVEKQPAETQVDASLSFLATAVAKTVVETKGEEIRNEIIGDTIKNFNESVSEIENRFNEKVQEVEKTSEDIIEKTKNLTEQYILDTYGPIHRKIETEVVVDDAKTTVDGVTHAKFEQVLKFVANDEPVYLVGRAGTGKNVICKQVAKALNLDFYFSNAITQEYKITGFVDAGGHYIETQFYKAFKNGGLFMLDEIDASIPEVLVILNAAIANRYFDFPGVGYVDAHPDFRVVAAGNTLGLGADYEYCGRSQLDAASLDRFAMVEIDYDRNIELNCANGDENLVKFCHKVRRVCREAGINIIVSYRSIRRIAKLKNVMSLEEVLKTCLFKTFTLDDFNTIIKEWEKSSGKYTDALKNLVSSLKSENE